MNDNWFSILAIEETAEEETDVINDTPVGSQIGEASSRLLSARESLLKKKLDDES